MHREPFKDSKPSLHAKTKSMKKYTLDIVFDYLDIKCNARDTRYNRMHNKNKNDMLEVFA